MHAQQYRLGYWVTILLLVIGVLIMLFPLAWLISTALKSQASAFNGQLIPTNPTFSNFSQILTPNQNAAVPRWLLNSLVVAGITSLLVVLVDSLAAFALARLHFFGRTFLLYLVIASLVVPFIALLLPLYLEFSGLNLLDTYFALILPYSANGFGVFLLYQFFRAIPKDLEEAATVEGASKFQVWRRIFVPLSIPATATLALLTFMNVYNDFFWPLVASSSLNMRTLTVGVAIMAIGAYNTNYPLLMALTLFSVIPMVLAFLFAQKQLVEGVATTGLKE
jgi:multiple sugar transport system permease protein